MTAPVCFPWLPPAGTVWNVEAGEYWDAVRISRRLGLPAVEQLGGRCGAVILDAWTRVMYWLVPARSTAGWEVPQTVACSTTTYVAVPSLVSSEHGLHWLMPPSRERCLTETVLLRGALLAAIDAELGPRPGVAQ